MISKEFDIIKQTPKTYTVKKKACTERIMKSCLGVVTADFSNNSVHRLQFKIIDVAENKSEAIEKLRVQIEMKIRFLEKLSKNALDAFYKGPKEIKS